MTEVKVNPKILQEVVKTLVKQKKAHIYLNSTSKSLQFYDNEGFSMSVSEDMLLSNSVKDEGNTTAAYSTEYLKDIFRGCKIPSFITFRFKKDSVAEVVYAIGDAQVKYWLAPRIEAA